MKGTRLLGIPVGSSPISAEGWAPTGLKYLRDIALIDSMAAILS